MHITVVCYILCYYIYAYHIIVVSCVCVTVMVFCILGL